jgi:hypothetical protein
MPRYLVERTFPDRLRISVGPVLEGNAGEGVTWVHSYVTEDERKTFCIYEAPSPEAIRKTAARNDLPVERITQVRVLDPYFYARRDDAMTASALPNEAAIGSAGTDTRGGDRQ